jgi:hypothetical protein
MSVIVCGLFCEANVYGLFFKLISPPEDLLCSIIIWITSVT